MGQSSGVNRERIDLVGWGRGPGYVGRLGWTVEPSEVRPDRWVLRYYGVLHGTYGSEPEAMAAADKFIDSGI